MRVFDADKLEQAINLYYNVNNGGKLSLDAEQILKMLHTMHTVDLSKVEDGWIPRSTPPKKYGDYLCRYTFGEDGILYFYNVLTYYAYDDTPHFSHELAGNSNSAKLRVTHWMPIPGNKEDL